MSKILEGKVYVFSGFRDISLSTYIRDRGGEVWTGVGPAADMLIMKNINEETADSTRAKELGVKIISLSDFKAYELPPPQPPMPAGDAPVKAKRFPIVARYDLIPGEVMQLVAEGLGRGAIKYGEKNWQESRLVGVNGPINHALKHLNQYNAGIKDDESDDPNVHLVNTLMNVIFELYYNLNGVKE